LKRKNEEIEKQLRLKRLSTKLIQLIKNEFPFDFRFEDLAKYDRMVSNFAEELGFEYKYDNKVKKKSNKRD